MQQIIDWAAGAQHVVINFLMLNLHVPPYLLKLIGSLVVVFVICLFIWKFSAQLSRRDHFSLDMEGLRQASGARKISKIAFFVLKYLFLFPIYTIVWGSILVLLLILLVEPGQYPNVLFFATVAIGAIRAMAYVNEEFASDLAKVLPLSILVTALVNPAILTKITVSISLSALFSGDIVMLSIAFIVFEEWFLRALIGVKNMYSAKKKAS